jgi:hypothetical protein
MVTPEEERDRSDLCWAIAKQAPEVLGTLTGTPFERYQCIRDEGHSRIAIANDLCLEAPRSANFCGFNGALHLWARRWHLLDWMKQGWFSRSIIHTLEGWYVEPELREPEAPELRELRLCSDMIWLTAPLAREVLAHPDFMTREAALRQRDAIDERRGHLYPERDVRPPLDGETWLALVRFQILGHGYSEIVRHRGRGNPSSLNRLVGNAAERLGLPLRDSRPGRPSKT